VASLAGGYARGLGELWKFEPSTGLWTWVGGSNVADAEGIFGSERGIAMASTVSFAALEFRLLST
jgi:hypothetical protein